MVQENWVDSLLVPPGRRLAQPPPPPDLLGAPVNLQAGVGGCGERLAPKSLRDAPGGLWMKA